MIGSRRQTSKAIEAFFSNTDVTPESKAHWPPALIDQVASYCSSFSPLDRGASSCSRLHDELLRLQQIAKDKHVPDAGFLQGLALLAPLLGHEDHLLEWFRAYVNPAINSAGHKNDVVEASRKFISAVLDKGNFPLFTTSASLLKQHPSAGTDPDPELRNISSANSNSTSSAPGSSDSTTSTSSNIPAQPLNILSPVSTENSTTNGTSNTSTNNSISLASSALRSISESKESHPDAASSSDQNSSTNSNPDDQSNGSSLEEKLNDNPSNPTNSISFTATSLNDTPHTIETSSELYFHWILDIFLGAPSPHTWFKFKETGLDRDERRRFVVKNARDLLLSWGHGHEKLFFERLNYRATQAQHRQQIFSLVSGFISENPEANVGIITSTPLFQTITNSLRYDSSSTGLNIATKILAMIIPYMATTASRSDIANIFMLYGRLACWSSFSYDFTTSAFTGKTKPSDSPSDDQGIPQPPEVAVPYGWSVLTKVYDIPDVHIIDISPIFTCLYGLYPANVFSFISSPADFINSILKSDTRLPEAWNDAIIADRSHQLFDYYTINPLLIKFTKEQELDPKTAASLGTPLDIAAHCIALHDRFRDTVVDSRRRSSLIEIHPQSQLTNINNNTRQLDSIEQEPNDDADDDEFGACRLLFDYNGDENEITDMSLSSPSTTPINTFTNSTTPKDPFPSESPRSIPLGTKSNEISLIASPMQYRRNSNNSQATPRLTVCTPSIRGIEDLLSESQQIFKKDENGSNGHDRKGFRSYRPPTRQFSEPIPDVSLDDTAPGSLSIVSAAAHPVLSNHSVTAVSSTPGSSILSSSPPSHQPIKPAAPTNARRMTPSSPLVRPLAEAMASPLLVGLSEPSSSVTPVNVNSPPIPITGTPRVTPPVAVSSSFADPEPMRLSPNMRTTVTVSSPELAPLSSLRPAQYVLQQQQQQQQPLKKQEKTEKTPKNIKKRNNRPSSSYIVDAAKGNAENVNNGGAITTLFYHREFSILRNEFDFLNYLEFHNRYQMRRLMHSRLQDKMFIQTIETLAQSNLKLHSILDSLQKHLDEAGAQVKEQRSKFSISEASLIQKVKSLQTELDTLTREHEILKDQHETSKTENQELIASVLSKEERIAFMELNITELNKDDMKAAGYKKKLLDAEKTIEQLESKTENFLSPEESKAASDFLVRFKEYNKMRESEEKAKEMSDRQFRLQINNLQAKLKDAEEKASRPSKMMLQSIEDIRIRAEYKNRELEIAYQELDERYTRLDAEFQKYAIRMERAQNDFMENYNMKSLQNRLPSESYSMGEPSDPGAPIPMYVPQERSSTSSHSDGSMHSGPRGSTATGNSNPHHPSVSTTRSMSHGPSQGGGQQSRWTSPQTSPSHGPQASTGPVPQLPRRDMRFRGRGGVQSSIKVLESASTPHPPGSQRGRSPNEHRG